MDPKQQRDVRRRRTRRAQAALVTAGVVGALGTATAVGLTTATASSTGTAEQSPATGTSGDQTPTARTDDGSGSTGLLGGGLVAPGSGTAPQARSGGS